MQLNNNVATKCDCVRLFLQKVPPSDITKVADYMIHWASLKRKTKLELLHERKCVADFIEGSKGEVVNVANEQSSGIGRSYRIPGAIRSNHSICRNGLCGLLGVGKDLWRNAMRSEGKRVHALKGRTAGSSNRGKEKIEIHQSLDS